MNNTPKRKHNRLADDMYCLPGAYFITICAADRRKVFWQNSSGPSSPDASLSNIGQIAEAYILDIPSHYGGTVEVSKYVVMPNHIHLLLAIKNTDDRTCPDVRHVVRLYKSAVTHHIGQSVWQKGFHDRIVRSMDEYRDIWKYIDENPIKWQLDRYYT